MILLTYFLLFLPSAVCLFWAITLSLTSRNTRAFPQILAFMLACGLSLYLTMCFTIRDIPLGDVPILCLVNMLTAPCVLPLLVLYVRELRPGVHPFSIWDIIWMIVPAVLFTGDTVFYLLSDNRILASLVSESQTSGSAVLAVSESGPEHLFLLWEYRVLPGILLAMFVIYVVGYIALGFKERIRPGNYWDFLRGRIDISVFELQYALGGLLLAIFLIYGIWMSTGLFVMPQWLLGLMNVLMMLTLLLMGCVAMVAAQPRVKRPIFGGLSIAWPRFEDEEETDEKETEEGLLEPVASVVQDGEDDPTGIDRVMTLMNASWDDNSLLSRFQRLMLKEKLFLQPGLTLSDVADRLDSNKTYVSRMVNNTFGLGFPELLNTLRVDYAEQYILHHRRAHQEEIAHACGFMTASAFNNVFKKTTGYTPKMWMATYDRDHRP